MLNDYSFSNNLNSIGANSPLGMYGGHDRTVVGVGFNQFYDDDDLLNKSGTTCAASGSRGDSLPWVDGGGGDVDASSSGPINVGSSVGASMYVSDITIQGRGLDITSYMDDHDDHVPRNVSFALPSVHSTTTPQYRFHIKVGVERVHEQCTSFGGFSVDDDGGDVDDESCRLASLQEFVMKNLQTKRNTSNIGNNNGVTSVSSIQHSQQSSLPSSVPVDVQADIIAKYLLTYHHHTTALSSGQSASLSPIGLAPLAPLHQHTPSSFRLFNGTSPPRQPQQSVGVALSSSPQHYVGIGNQTPTIGNALTAFKAFDRFAAMSVESGSIRRPGFDSQQSPSHTPRQYVTPPHATSSIPTDLPIVPLSSGWGSGGGGIIASSGGVGIGSSTGPQLPRSQSFSTSTIPDDPTHPGEEQQRSRAMSYMSGMIPLRSIHGGTGGGGDRPARRSLFSQHQHFGAAAMSCSMAEGDVGVVSELKAGEEMDTGFDMINDYIVWDQISSGSQGATFEVIDTRGGGKRCMKVVRRDLILHRRTEDSADDDDGGGTERRMSTALGLRLHREVAIMKRLRHPNIVRLHEVIDDPTVNSVYMFMDLVNGGPLCKEMSPAQLQPPPQHAQPESFSASTELGSVTLPQKRGTARSQRRISLSSGVIGSLSASAISASASPLADVRFEPIPFDIIVRFAHQIAGGLRYLHRHGIVHRDVKPDNILIDKTTNKAVIVDFGVSESDTTKADPMVIVGGAVTGTPAFVAPELWDGGGSVSGISADVWSLGVTLFVATVGFLPYVGGSTAELRESIISDPPKKFPANWWKSNHTSSSDSHHQHQQLYIQWESIVMSLLDKDASSRLTLTDLLQHPLFVSTGVVPPPPPPSTSTTFTTSTSKDDIVRQGSPTRWVRQQQHHEQHISEHPIDEPVVVDRTPSPDELHHAIDGLRTHRRLSLVPSTSIQHPPPYQQHQHQHQQKQQLPPPILLPDSLVPHPPIPPQRALPKSRSAHALQQ